MAFSLQKFRDEHSLVYVDINVSDHSSLYTVQLVARSGKAPDEGAADDSTLAQLTLEQQRFVIANQICEAILLLQV